MAIKRFMSLFTEESTKDKILAKKPEQEIVNKEELQEAVGALRAYARKLEEEYEQEKNSSWRPFKETNLEIKKGKIHDLKALANAMAMRFGQYNSNYPFNETNFLNFLKAQNTEKLFAHGLSKNTSRTEELIKSIWTENFTKQVETLDLKITDNDRELTRVSTVAKKPM